MTSARAQRIHAILAGSGKALLRDVMRYVYSIRLVLPVAFWLMAALLRWWAAPAFELLPADYVAETSYTANLRSRETPSSPAEDIESIVRRRDETLSSGDGHSIIQGDAHWSTLAGTIIFESRNLYGVDRRTGQNLAGYGNEKRIGQYLFPRHTEKQQYGFWDPIYAGPAVVSFDHVDHVGGIEVYVFNFQINGIDETAGFAALPDVPEKYRALTFSKGLLWVEPVSGIIVDREDTGVSYFVEPKTGEHVGEPILQGSERYTPATIEAQLRIAKATRWRMHALEVWLPVVFVVAGLLAAGIGTLRRSAR